MCECMTFPDTVEEFMEAYKVVDTDHVYSNGTEFVPIFRMKQWFEHISAQPEWNNHTVACLLADLYDDPCACNYNNISEWLPEKCEVIDSCPNPVGVACWEQFLKHRAERREDG